MAPHDRKLTMSSSSDDDFKRKKTFFKQRFPGFKKKATELSVLCGNSVGFICHGPDNDLHVWPEPQENPQALPEIVAKFNGLTDLKRKSHACDLYDFPNFKGLSGDDLRIHLDKLNSHLVGIKQHKISILRRGNSKKPKQKETEEDDHLRVSDNATISNCKACPLEDQSRTLLGFDELGYVVRGSQETVSNLGSCDTPTVSTVNEADSFGVDPFTLGFTYGEYFPAEPMADTDLSWMDKGFTDSEYFVAEPMAVTDLSWMDREFTSTLFADDWTVSDCNPLFESHSFMQITDNLGSVF